MTFALSSSLTAISPGLTSSFLATGGGAPQYSVIPGGAGGTIGTFDGLYRAPAQYNPSINGAFDTIQATDGVNVATSQILVGLPLMLFCDILAKGMGLDPSRVVLWNEKWFSPIDYGLWIVVSVLRCKPFSNIREEAMVNGVFSQIQFTNMRATLDVDIVSRGPEARDRKEQVVLSLYTTYSEQQQEANSFSIARVPPNQQFIDVSERNLGGVAIDGTAMPYRFRISVNMMYASASLITPIPFIDQFQTPQIFLDNFVPSYGYGIRTLYDQRPVGLTDWVVLIFDLQQTTTALRIFDSSGQIMELGICNYNAPPNAEVRQFLVPPGGIELDTAIIFGQRISIRAVSAPATTGEIDLSVFF